jgi:molecular chaperone DnaK
VKQAELNKEADAKKKQLIETRNNAETTFHSIEKSLIDFKSMLTEEAIEKLKKEVASLREYFEKPDASGVVAKEMTEKLQQLSWSTFEESYKVTKFSHCFCLIFL